MIVITWQPRGLNYFAGPLTSKPISWVRLPASVIPPIPPVPPFTIIIIEGSLGFETSFPSFSMSLGQPTNTTFIPFQNNSVFIDEIPPQLPVYPFPNNSVCLGQPGNTSFIPFPNESEQIPQPGQPQQLPVIPFPIETDALGQPINVPYIPFQNPSITIPQPKN